MLKRLLNKKLEPSEIDRKILSITSLMESRGWKEFSEMIQYLQGLRSMRLFDKRFLVLNPEQKDKEHAVIVAVIEELDKLLHLPKWLADRKPEKWTQVVDYLNKEASNG